MAGFKQPFTSRPVISTVKTTLCIVPITIFLLGLIFYLLEAYILLSLGFFKGPYEGENLPNYKSCRMFVSNLRLLSKLCLSSVTRLTSKAF